MTPGDANTRDRLLDAAIALFARQGYASTSVADIQQACGLSAGSGALYKHFPPKSALLQHATHRQVDPIVAAREAHDLSRPADAHEALRRAAEQIWGTIEGNADDLWSAVTFNAYDRMASTLSAAAAAGSSCRS
jgi:AcrR family transcriptional regulator